jgi:hypothetical protein
MIDMRGIVAWIAIWLYACGGGPEGDDAATADTGLVIDGALDGSPPDSTPGDGGSDSGSGPSVEDFQRAYSEATCGMFVTCESFFGLGSLRVVYQTRCHPAKQEWDTYDAALVAGTIIYDAAAAARCLETFDGASCAELYSVLGSLCTDVWVPTVAPGGACAINAECIDGRCVTDAECPGTCVADGDAGDACAPPVPSCGPDLVCRDGACRVRGDAGATCMFELDCADGLVCLSSTCSARPGAGETCSPSATSQCSDSLVCDPATETCVDGAVEGESCAALPCAVGRRCDPVTDTCVTAALPGSACSDDVECPYAFFCDAGTCAPLPVPGESCASAPVCARGACTAGVCALVPEGESCDTGELFPPFGACADGLTCGTGRICTPRLAEGDPCASTVQCLETHECRSDVCYPRCTPG